MNRENFYSGHWVEIEEDRLQRYEEMFQWRPEQDALLVPLDLKSGQTVLDFGCGPGFLSMEIARRVGEEGRVVGVDLNARFVERATDRASDAGLANLEFRRVQDERLPIADSSVDRVICKNVLEYVPDASTALAEHTRVLKPGGLIEVIDSDWGFVIVEPWGKSGVEAFFDAARGAFREPFIGRKTSGLLNRAGLDDIRVNVSPFVDREGRGLPVLLNMVSYIRTFGNMPDEEIDSMMEELSSAIDSGNYLFVLPQFIVTGRKPE